MNHIILFDLDGTLTDPKEGITKSVQHALQAYGIDEPDLDKLCPFIGPPLSDSFKEYYGFSEAQAREAIGYFHEYFTKQGMFENKVYPGIREMLTRLKDAGLTLGGGNLKAGTGLLFRFWSILICFPTLPWLAGRIWRRSGSAKAM